MLFSILSNCLAYLFFIAIMHYRNAIFTSTHLTLGFTKSFISCLLPPVLILFLFLVSSVPLFLIRFPPFGRYKTIFWNFFYFVLTECSPFIVCRIFTVFYHSLGICSSSSCYIREPVANFVKSLLRKVQVKYWIFLCLLRIVNLSINSVWIEGKIFAQKWLHFFNEIYI